MIRAFIFITLLCILLYVSIPSSSYCHCDKISVGNESKIDQSNLQKEVNQSNLQKEKDLHKEIDQSKEEHQDETMKSWTIDENLDIHTQNIYPYTDKMYTLGSPTHRWNNIYGNVISTSDQNAKKEIRPITHGLSFLKQMKPVSFRWKDQELQDRQGRKFIRKHLRAHLGFIAQDIERLLEHENIPTSEFGAFIKHPDGLGLRHEELLPIHTKAIQELAAQVERMQQQLDDILSANK